jgi:membrane fusion protein (multidrug efflux system)
LFIRSLTKVVSVAALALVVASCDEQQAGGGAGAGGQNPGVAVNTMVLNAGKVRLTEEMPGRTVAFRKTDVRPQVDGIIEARKFEEGAYVEQDQALYVIDQAVYVAALDAAKAELDRQTATLSQAVKNRKRYEKLIKTKALSEQKYDDAVATEAQARAAVAAAQAQVDRAQINMEDTTVRAPISGQIGASAFNEGSLVTASQASALATITQLDPIYVDVIQAGGRLMKIKHAVQSGRLQGVDAGKIEVSLTMDATGVQYPHKGTLKFSDVSVNETTGTVRLRAVFPNPDRDLLPGMFVRGTVYQGELDNVFVVPQKAVMRRPDGTAFVYAVEEGKVVVKAITIEQSQDSNWLVTDGLSDGVEIIVEGLQRVAPGAAVVAQPIDAANAAKPSK